MERALTLVKSSWSKKRAFTLIELLIVIAIIAILASIIFINLASARKKANDTKIKSDIAEVSKAIEIARLDDKLTDAGVPISWKAIGSGTAYDLSAKIVDATGTKLIPSNPKYPVSPSGTNAYFIMKANTDDIYLWAPLVTNTRIGWCVINGNILNSAGTVKTACHL